MKRPPISDAQMDLLATYGTGWKSAVNFMRPANSAGTPAQ